MAGQIVNDLIGAEGMAAEDDVLVAFLLGKGDVSVEVVVGIGKAFVPRADRLLLAGTDVDRRDFTEGVVGLGVDEIDVTAV